MPPTTRGADPFRPRSEQELAQTFDGKIERTLESTIYAGRLPPTGVDMTERCRRTRVRMYPGGGHGCILFPQGDPQYMRTDYVARTFWLAVPVCATALFAQVIAAQSVEQDQYSSNLQLSNVHARLQGRDAVITGSVKNIGSSTVTALLAKVRLLGRNGAPLRSDDVNIILAGSSSVPPDVAEPLKAGETRAFNATLLGVPRSWSPGKVKVDLTSVRTAGAGNSSAEDSGGAAGVFALLVVVVALMGLVVRMSIKNAKKRQAVLAEQRQWAQAAIEQLETAEGDPSKLPDLREQVRGLVLHGGERCFAACKGVQHLVEGRRTRYVGGSQGVSIRIAKGVRYHVGGFSGRPVTTTFEKVNDVGDVYVTTERIVFAGGREVTSVAGKKVADVRVEGDHIWVIVENRKTPLAIRFPSAPAVAPVIAYATRLLADACQHSQTRTDLSRVDN
jgi:hypothetical protein